VYNYFLGHSSAKPCAAAFPAIHYNTATKPSSRPQRGFVTVWQPFSSIKFFQQSILVPSKLTFAKKYMEKYTVGNATIYPLSEGSFTIDKTKIFVPFNEEKDNLQQRPTGSLLVEVQPFLIAINNDIILIDAGLGFSYHQQLQLIHNLQNIGYTASNITKVLMSHLHKDHAGGISVRNNLGSYQLAFPNATYFVQQQEFATAMNIGFPSYMTEELECLQNNPQVQWLHGNGRIENYIDYEITGGHSMYHQVFTIHTNNGKIFFGGDDAPQLQQMKSKFVAKYDYDGKKCMELRNLWWQKGATENWTYLFYHDIKTPVFTHA
jgi:glyoxylase-like metal-dependent hydrolase (beta-lactamase superfamily II)